MRLGSTILVAGLAVLTAGSAQAQTSYQATTPSTGYVYTGNQNTASPIYNTNSQPLPMQQMIKGKNSPSYNFKGSSQPYNFGTRDDKSGPMTVEEADRIRAMRDAQAAEYEKNLVARINAQNAAPNGQAGTNGYGDLRQFLPGAQQPQPQRKKRLVYREDADPLRIPPRLFNPDQ